MGVLRLCAGSFCSWKFWEKLYHLTSLVTTCLLCGPARCHLLLLLSAKSSALLTLVVLWANPKWFSSLCNYSYTEHSTPLSALGGPGPCPDSHCCSFQPKPRSQGNSLSCFLQPHSCPLYDKCAISSAGLSAIKFPSLILARDSHEPRAPEGRFAD